jgi:glycosyltransferase involved in cell wall biosynthesis
MTIGFDAKRLFHNDTGLGTYSRVLLQALGKYYPDHRYLLFAKSPEKSRYFAAFEKFETISSTRALWRTKGMVREIKAEGCEIYHGLSHELPIGIQQTDTKSIVTIHDVIFKTEPHLYPALDRMVYNLKWKHSCQKADIIIAVSEQTKRDLCSYYQVAPQKIRVIPPPIADKIILSDGMEVAKRYHLPQLFYLAVGSITPRKNLLSILKAMLMIDKKKRIPLVIVGRGPQERELKNFVLRNKLDQLVIFVGYITDDELPNFYQLAFALIYPSLYEGFGIPIVESLRNKRPVITSNTSSMPEAAGPGALLINPNQPSEIAENMLKLLSDQKCYDQLVDEGYVYTERFSPERICQTQMELYQSLLINE